MAREESRPTKAGVKAALLSLLGVGALGALYWRTSGSQLPEHAPGQEVATASSGSPDDAPRAAGHDEQVPAGYAWRLEPDRVHLVGPVMGTKFTVTIAGPSGLDPEARVLAAATTYEALERINAEMSTYIEDSALSTFNRAPAGTVQSVSPDFSSVFQISKTVHEASQGAFDPTVGPLVRAWGFGPEAKPDEVLSEAEVQALRPRLGFDSLRLEGGDPLAGTPVTLTKTRAEVELDFSAVAKGHAADAVCRELEALGHIHVMVEVGGEICVRGRSKPEAPKGEGAWRVGVERPVARVGKAPGEQGIERIVKLGAWDARAIATSGDYRNYYERDGKRLSHTIDPRTGRPIEHKLASVSVLSTSAGMADAWATALSVLGPDAGFELATSQGLSAYMLVRDPTAPGGFAERITEPFEAHSVTLPPPPTAPATP